MSSTMRDPGHQWPIPTTSRLQMELLQVWRLVLCWEKLQPGSSQVYSLWQIHLHMEAASLQANHGTRLSSAPLVMCLS